MLGILGALNDSFPTNCWGSSRHLGRMGYVGSKCSHHREVQLGEVEYVRGSILAEPTSAMTYIGGGRGESAH